MPLSKYLMSRAEYDAYCREQFEEASPNNPDGIDRAMARRYPKSTEMAVEELKRRGLRIDVEQLSRRVTPEFRQIGRNFVWFADDIDDVAAALDQAHRLTYEAHYRKEEGLSYAEHAAIRRQVHAKRLANMQRVADAVGGTIPDVNDSVSNVMPDPVEWTDEQFQEAITRTKAFLAGQAVAR